MNLTQAKSLVGISGPISMADASARCKAAIVQARKAGKDGLAAELSEAWQVFKRRPRCEACGTPINPGARFCSAHVRRQTPQIGASTPRAKKPKKAGSNIRVTTCPRGGLLAMHGFYASPVQRVFKKWSTSQPPHLLEEAFLTAAACVTHRVTNPGMVSWPQFMVSWPAFFELGSAISGVISDAGKPHGWLFKLPIAVEENGRAPSFPEIAKMIHDNGGPLFKTSAIKEAYRSLRLDADKNLAREYRSFRRQN